MALTARTHFYKPMIDEKGDLYRYVRVRIYEDDGKTLFKGKIYRDGVTEKIYSNPFVAAPALINVYFEGPVRIRLGIQLDTTKTEKIGDVIDVPFDADLSVYTALDSLYVKGSWTRSALLCGVDETNAYWKPLRVDHEHEAVAPNTVLLGPMRVGLRQAGAFKQTTIVGADSGGWGAASSLNSASALGSMTDAYGRGTLAVGRNAFAEEGRTSPWKGSSLAVGRDAESHTEGTALGSQAVAGDSAVVLSAVTRAPQANSVVLGYGAVSAQNGIALGRGAGSKSAGQPGSIGVGAGAQYGLPSTTDPAKTSVLLGAHDPGSARRFPWPNPNESQSESPWEEYRPTMIFDEKTIQIQRHLTWVADLAAMVVGGDATLGSRGGVLGFYGVAPRVQGSVGDDEPVSGITALDNLIYALRDLNLLRARTEPILLYRSEDVRNLYTHGDRVIEWPEHFGRGTALPVADGRPWYYSRDPEYNEHPTLIFENSVYRRSTRPITELRGPDRLPATQHFISVAEHQYRTFGNREGLVNMTTPDSVPREDGQVLMSEGFDTTRWELPPGATYERDGLDQTRNREADLRSGAPGAQHVYQVSHPTAWPYGRPIIAGPRDAAVDGDRWSGSVAEIVGLDSTWDLAAVRSMSRGLMFKYNIAQQDSWLRRPARDFLITQHDPMNNTLVFWDRDYPDWFIGKCYGKAIRVQKPVIYTPFISIYFSFNYFSFRGGLVGNWGNIGVSFSSQYEVQVSTIIGDLDGDGDIDVETNFNASRETHLGIFSLNNNLTWSMGQISSSVGYKVCRIRHRVTKTVVCISGDPPYRYQDTEVQVFSTKPDGSLLLEGTSPLWGDGTFSVRVRHQGKKIARVIEKSTGNVLGTTEYQDKALPRTALYADDDPEVSFANRDRATSRASAQAAMAMLELPIENWYRSRQVLRTLRLVANSNGSLNDAYSSVLPAKATGTTSLSGTIWAALACLRYQQATGSDEFMPFARTMADWIATQDSTLTEEIALAWFLFRDLANVTGVSAYATRADALRTTLLTSCWLPDPGRWKEGPSTDAESLWAAVYGGLFAQAIGDRAKSRASVRALKRYRTKNQQVSAPHYAGQTGLIGYKPYADAGANARPNPPTVIDQSGTWAAILFKLRYGEPAGDDVYSLYRWAQTTILNDPTRDLYGAQFLSHNANALTAPYSLRARPHLSVASWARMMASGGKDLFTRDPMVMPAISVPVCTPRIDRPNNRCRLHYSFFLAISINISVSIYEAVPECSYDGGLSWTVLSHLSVQASFSSSIDLSIGSNGYSNFWDIGLGDTPGTLIRARVRARGTTTIGRWQTSAAVSLPSRV